MSPEAANRSGARRSSPSSRFIFPSLVAGPIKRYQEFTAALPQALARVELTDVAAGAQRVALGFFKKILLADNLTVALAFYEKISPP